MYDIVWLTNVCMTLAGIPPYIAGKSVYIACFKWKPGFRVLRLAIQPTDRLFAIH